MGLQISWPIDLVNVLYSRSLVELATIYPGIEISLNSLTLSQLAFVTCGLSCSEGQETCTVSDVCA